MFKHAFEFVCQFSRSVHHECIAHMYAFIECFLLPQEVCLHCLYWEWLKVRSVDVPKHTLCSLMQHYIEMSRHFGKLNTCVHAHERIAGSAVG